MMFGWKMSPGGPAALIAIVVVVVVGALRSAPAQDAAQNAATAAAPKPAVPNTATSSSLPPKVLTGKERLGRKWMDEQRVDNCRVPIDKRGAKPRPDTCADGSE
jgi:hypothetical protein